LDLYNKNYIIRDNRKYVRICLGKYDEQLAPVNNSFRIIILVNKNFINNLDTPILNRFEKIKISFHNLLDDRQRKLTKRIIKEINLKYYIRNFQKKISINYDLKDLLINCGTEEIEGLIYNYSVKNRNNNNKIDEEIITERVYDKISNILPQDIICILPDNNVIKKAYYEKKNIIILKVI
jgi:hypothetical protein